MTAHQNAGTPPDARADRAPLHRGRRRPAVAYAAANIASAIPLTPGGLGVIEVVTLVAITVGFGAPRATAVLAVLGYRIVNYWLPLPSGAIAYLRLRLRPGADGKRKGKGKPAVPQAG